MINVFKRNRIRDPRDELLEYVSQLGGKLFTPCAPQLLSIASGETDMAQKIKD
jgi:hypothetical protein